MLRHSSSQAVRQRRRRGEFAGYRRRDPQALAARRVVEAQFGTCQQQPATVEFVGEEAVVPTLAIGRVADDRVGDMFQVAAQLVAAAGQRFQFEQGVAAGRVAVDRYRQLDFSQFAVMRQRGCASVLLCSPRNR